MAFESQMAAQREQSKQRIIIKHNVFLLQTSERKKGTKKEDVLRVRVPLDVLKAAKIDVKKPMDVFYDHESQKAMLANSLGGVKWIVKGAAAEAIFLFAKGFTPDFGSTIVERYELVPHGDGQGVVFDYRPRMMVEGLNALNDGEQPTRPQRVAQALVAAEEQRLNDERAAKGISSAPPMTTQKFEVKTDLPNDGIRTRRSFTEEERKEGVRAHKRWMDTGMGFDKACEEVGVVPSLMRNWREKYLKAVTREESQHGHGGKRKPALNGAHAH